MLPSGGNTQRCLPSHSNLFRLVKTLTSGSLSMYTKFLQQRHWKLLLSCRTPLESASFNSPKCHSKFVLYNIKNNKPSVHNAYQTARRQIPAQRAYNLYFSNCYDLKFKKRANTCNNTNSTNKINVYFSPSSIFNPPKRISPFLFFLPVFTIILECRTLKIYILN